MNDDDYARRITIARLLFLLVRPGRGPEPPTALVLRQDLTIKIIADRLAELLVEVE